LEKPSLETVAGWGERKMSVDTFIKQERRKGAARSGSFVSRLHARSSSAAMVRLGTTKCTLAARLVDVSVSGLKCKVRQGLIPNVGETILVEWPDGSTSFASLQWINEQQLGLHLDCLTPDIGDRIDTASLGLESYCRLIGLQISSAS
jgi:hypothetical protein